MYEHDDDIHPAPPSDDKLKTVKDKDELIANLNAILKGPMGKDDESDFIKMVQRQRTLMLDIATQTFISKPNNPKLLDSINTLLAGLERTVRDDRKERLKDRELEDNKANFATFVNALNEVAAGRLVMPNYGGQAIVLDPMAPLPGLSNNPDDAISDDELYQGRQMVNPKEIEKSFENEDGDFTINTTDEDDDDDSEFDPEM